MEKYNAELFVKTNLEFTEEDLREFIIFWVKQHPSIYNEDNIDHIGVNNWSSEELITEFQSWGDILEIKAALIQFLQNKGKIATNYHIKDLALFIDF